MRIFVVAGALALALAPSSQAQSPMGFFPLIPCRLWDTRQPPPGQPPPGPKINANTSRSFPVRGVCGVPDTAQAVVINLTVTQQNDLGNLRAYPAGTTAPLASVLNFVGDGFAIANGATIPLGTSGANHITIQVDMPAGSTGSLHCLADVTGYFQPVQP